MKTVVHCYCFTGSQPVSGLNGESTKNVFMSHYRAGKTVNFDQLTGRVLW